MVTTRAGSEAGSGSSSMVFAALRPTMPSAMAIAREKVATAASCHLRESVRRVRIDGRLWHAGRQRGRVNSICFAMRQRADGKSGPYSDRGAATGDLCPKPGPSLCLFVELHMNRELSRNMFGTTIAEFRHVDAGE